MPVDGYNRLLSSIGRTVHEDERVLYHEISHYLVDRITATYSISFISITPSGDYEGICLGARNQAFVKAGADGPGRFDAADVRHILSPTMPKAGETRADKSDVYTSVLDAVTQLMAGEAGERLMLGDAQYAFDDRRQGAELSALICKSDAATKLFIEFCLQQAIDMLSEHVTLLWSLGIILRMRRDMTGAEMDQAMSSILASQQATIERLQRRAWQATLDNAGQFQCEPMRKE
jgi:hypothetical protein